MHPEIIVKRSYVGAMRVLKKTLRAVGALNWLEARAHNSRQSHWLRSLMAIHDIEDMVHLDFPWWVYEAIDEVEAFLAARPNARVFEWGSGASTIWLARRAGSVTTVEHTPWWADIVRKQLARIVVDGRVRAQCLTHALAKLTPGGMIVFDNSFRGRYSASIRDSGLNIVRHRGRAPALPYTDETTILSDVHA